MKRIEDITTSLEVSKRLKEAGFPQDSLFYWNKNIESAPYHLGIGKMGTEQPESIAAPTATELLEKLGTKYLPYKMQNNWYCIEIKGFGTYVLHEDTKSNKPADSLAIRYIYLSEQNLLSGGD
jgi:hypothetical protein